MFLGESYPFWSVDSIGSSVVHMKADVITSDMTGLANTAMFIICLEKDQKTFCYHDCSPPPSSHFFGDINLNHLQFNILGTQTRVCFHWKAHQYSKYFHRLLTECFLHFCGSTYTCCYNIVFMGHLLCSSVFHRHLENAFLMIIKLWLLGMLRFKRFAQVGYHQAFSTF